MVSLKLEPKPVSVAKSGSRSKMLEHLTLTPNLEKKNKTLASGS